jgi:nicotinate-nucleotide adenylyltransferase
VRIGLFGGTFDPIHHAHLAVARAAAERFALDKVLLIPAASPPHKGLSSAPYGDRLNMVRLAVGKDPLLAASDLERGTGRSYSILTVERVKSDLQEDDELFFIIGADAFEEIETWYRWRDLLRSVEFIVVTRPGYTYDVPAGAITHEMGGLSLPVSSSDLRQKLARGEAPAEVPAAVRTYITEKGLYRQLAGEPKA